MKPDSITSVFYIRALASLMVCLFHLTCGNSNLFASDHFLFKIFSAGYLGVESLRYMDIDLQKYILWLLALAGSIGFAQLFYVWVEQPAMKWSKKIVYEN